jgi:hypothetical protein
MMKAHFIWRPYALLLLLALVATSAGGCHWGKDDPPPKQPNPLDALPPETNTGEDTFGCLINGVPFVARYRGDADARFDYSGWANDSIQMMILNITGFRDSKVIKDNLRFTGFAFNFPNVSESSPRILKLVSNGQLRTGTFGVTVDARHLPSNYPYTDIRSKDTDTGTLEITHYRRNFTSTSDTGANVISGRFSFEINHPKAGKISVTHGRFDSHFAF